MITKKDKKEQIIVEKCPKCFSKNQNYWIQEGLANRECLKCHHQWKLKVNNRLHPILIMKNDYESGKKKASYGKHNTKKDWIKL